MLGSLLKLITRLVYSESSNVFLITTAGILGVISVSGGEIGPFMPVEQSALAQLVEDCSDGNEHLAESVSVVFGYYSMAGNVSKATGAALAGLFISISILSYYYEKKYDLHYNKIGSILFVCNIVSGISGVLSSKLVDRFGAVATMIYTHLPSNIFLILIAFVRTPALSITLLFIRFCISEMDIPARQTYVAMVVSSGERSAANVMTNIARSVGLCLGLGLNGYFMKMDTDSFEFSCPFLITGALTIMYDITIGCCFLWRQSHQSAKEAKEVDQQIKQNENGGNPQVGYVELKEEQT